MCHIAFCSCSVRSLRGPALFEKRSGRALVTFAQVLRVLVQGWCSSVANGLLLQGIRSAFTHLSCNALLRLSPFGSSADNCASVSQEHVAFCCHLTVTDLWVLDVWVPQQGCLAELVDCLVGILQVNGLSATLSEDRHLYSTFDSSPRPFSARYGARC